MNSISFERDQKNTLKWKNDLQHFESRRPVVEAHCRTFTHGDTHVLIITTMNELEGLRSIWGTIPLQLFQRVIVVDGDSRDGTLEFLSDKSCQVLKQTLPGRGNAIRQAMEQVYEDTVVLMASDGNDNPEYVPALLRKLEDGYDIVSGSRFMKGGSTDDSDDPIGIRRVGNNFFTFLVNLFWNAKLSDAAYSLRAFRADAWRRMQMDSTRNETEFMMSIRAAKLGLKTAQIPVIEGNRVGGKVKARTLSTGWSFLNLLAAELVTT